MAKTLLILGLASCLTITGCRGEEPESTTRADTVSPVEDTATQISTPRDIAVRIDASKPSLRSEARTGKGGESSVIQTRYFVGNTLVLIEELVASSTTGQSETSYYLDDDRLAFFRGRGTRTIYSTGADPVTERFEIELGFDADSNLVDAVKIVNGEAAELERFDVEAPKARAGMLLLEDRP